MTSLFYHTLYTLVYRNSETNLSTTKEIFICKVDRIYPSVELPKGTRTRMIQDNGTRCLVRTK